MDAEARRAFYGRALEAFRRAGIPFLIGGAYAMRFFADVRRETKDLDVFIREEDWPAVRDLFEGMGCRTRLVSRFWLAKVAEGEWIVDLIFGSRNGICVVDEAWFEHAVETVLFDRPVRMVPLEEMIWSKAFVMERDRYDGADVAHLLLRRAEEIRWPRLMARFRGHEAVLLSHLILFTFIYPSERGRIPAGVFRTLLSRWRREPTPEAPVCRGTLLSQIQYLPDLHRGYLDARLRPYGKRSPEQVDEEERGSAPRTA